jgi:hypothetical protein
MDERSDFLGSLDRFLASGAFVDVVSDDRAQLPVTQHVVELHRDGSFTIYSRREDALHTPDTIILDIPPNGSPDEVRELLRRELSG